MKKKIFILGGLFIFFVICFTPAKLAEGFIPDNNPVSISGLNGTIWSGEVGQVSAMNLSLNEVEFSINLIDLFLFSPSVDLVINRGDLQGDLEVSLADFKQYLEINDANIELSAGNLSSHIPVPNVALGGDIVSRDLSVVAESKKLKFLEGTVNWRRAVVNYAGQEFALGDFGAVVTTNTDENVINAELLKTKNELGLQGKVKLAADGMLDFEGSIATDIDQTLYRTIALFNNGKPQNGRLPIKFKQRVLK